MIIEIDFFQNRSADNYKLLEKAESFYKKDQNNLDSKINNCLKNLSVISVGVLVSIPIPDKNGLLNEQMSFKIKKLTKSKCTLYFHPPVRPKL